MRVKRLFEKNFVWRRFEKRFIGLSKNQQHRRGEKSQPAESSGWLEWTAAMMSAERMVSICS